MTRIRMVIFFAVLSLSHSFTVTAKDPKKSEPIADRVRQPICDSQSFIEIATAVEEIRQERRLSEAVFAELVNEDGTIILDARSDGSYRSLRVKGSKNLPYTSFSAKTLEAVIPHRSTRILIYCRNNLLTSTPNQEKAKAKHNRHPYPNELGRENVVKAPKGGLNIPTFITLFIYGYENVWELDAVVDPNNSPIAFESEPPIESEVDDKTFDLGARWPLID